MHRYTVTGDPQLNRNGISAILKSAVTSLMLVLTAASALAQSPAPIDCPLRDKPFNLESPLLDVLLSPSASRVLESHLPSLKEKTPAMMLRTEIPTFGAIVSVTNVAHMLQLPANRFQALAADLAQLDVTDADRLARCARYDSEAPELEFPNAETNILVFNKINGFDHGPSVTAATHAIKALAEQLGWGVVVTTNGGAFTPEILARFDAVVWNNNSGDVLTLSQRQAFEDYITNGGGFLGIHGSGGDSIYYWDWYADKLLGARFIGHPMNPHFQHADVRIEPSASRIGTALKPGWNMKDEWYSFAESPRRNGASVVATLDESSYEPGHNLSMGEDHPIAWTRCVDNGRAFYTAIGHRTEVYHVPENLALLRDGLRWAAGQGASDCRANKPIKRRQQ